VINNLKVREFSKHLFWDLDPGVLDFEKNKKQIIQRVLEYGLLQDWLLISDCYGIKEIGETAQTIRALDNKSASFIAILSEIPKENFLCYTIQRLTPKHWNF